MLAAAVAAKQLEGLEAALAMVQVPHRTFYHGAPLIFTLHVPNMAAITALLADLRMEPVVDRALGLACSETDLVAQVRLSYAAACVRVADPRVRVADPLLTY